MHGFQAELRTEEDVWDFFGFFLPVSGGLSHRKAASTFLSRADLQQWPVNYDSYVGFSNGNSFQRFLRLRGLHQLMFTNETRWLLWTAVWLWNFEQLIHFEFVRCGCE